MMTLIVHVLVDITSSMVSFWLPINSSTRRVWHGKGSKVGSQEKREPLCYQSSSSSNQHPMRWKLENDVSRRDFEFRSDFTAWSSRRASLTPAPSGTHCYRTANSYVDEFLVRTWYLVVRHCFYSPSVKKNTRRRKNSTCSSFVASLVETTTTCSKHCL